MYRAFAVDGVVKLKRVRLFFFVVDILFYEMSNWVVLPCEMNILPKQWAEYMQLKWKKVSRIDQTKIDLQN